MKNGRAKRGFRRELRVNDLIQTALAKILQREAGSLLSGMMITVTGVDVAHDLAFAKVFISVLQEDKAVDVITALNKSSKLLRYQLASAVQLRIVPELRFVFDDSIVRGNRMASLVQDVSLS